MMHLCAWQVAGTSGKVQQGTDEDTEGISTEAHALAIADVLGDKRRNEVRCPLHSPFLHALSPTGHHACSGRRGSRLSASVQ